MNDRILGHDNQVVRRWNWRSGVEGRLGLLSSMRLVALDRAGRQPAARPEPVEPETIDDEAPPPQPIYDELPVDASLKTNQHVVDAILRETLDLVGIEALSSQGPSLRLVAPGVVADEPVAAHDAMTGDDEREPVLGAERTCRPRRRRRPWGG